MIMINEGYFDLTVDQRKQRAKLTPVEQMLMDDFLKAARALPKSLSVKVDEDADPYHLVVRKRITRGSCMAVGGIRKKSLVF